MGFCTNCMRYLNLMSKEELDKGIEKGIHPKHSILWWCSKCKGHIRNMPIGIGEGGTICDPGLEGSLWEFTQEEQKKFKRN